MHGGGVTQDLKSRESVAVYILDKNIMRPDVLATGLFY